MSLAPGQRLGPYAIVAPLGKGGMGEVWRATDTKLQRDVAIKILPAEVAGSNDGTHVYFSMTRKVGDLFLLENRAQP